MKRFGLYAAALAVTMATMLLFKGCGGGERNCTATAECLAGEICVNGKCANCHSATQCEPEYGLGATCESGTCQICPEGSVGCACDGQDTCTSGVCVLGKCVDCWAGTNDCVCREEGEFCDEGLRCNAQGLCEDCPALKSTPPTKARTLPVRDSIATIAAWGFSLTSILSRKN